MKQTLLIITALMLIVGCSSNNEHIIKETKKDKLLRLLDESDRALLNHDEARFEELVNEIEALKVGFSDFSEKEQKEINDKVEKSYRILQKREIEDRKEREAKLMEIRKKNMESMEKIRRGEKRWKRGY
jgi:uncharacterized protein YcfL|tara:strand:+ start:35 stop:421 length:387 start_codon:yes stop_codon:yes gene_type:complete